MAQDYTDDYLGNELVTTPPPSSDTGSGKSGSSGGGGSSSKKKPTTTSNQQNIPIEAYTLDQVNQGRAKAGVEPIQQSEIVDRHRAAVRSAVEKSRIETEQLMAAQAQAKIQTEQNRTDWDRFAERTNVESDYYQALNRIQDYKSGNGYDLVGYLRDNPNTEGVRTLKNAGFQDDDVNKAQVESLKPESLESFTDRYLAKNYKGKDFTESNIKDRKKLDSETYDEYYKRMAEKDEILRKATKAYVDKYGKGALALTGAARVGEFVFQPARALRPEITVKDIKGTEWAVGAANLALLAVPFVGGVVSKASPLAFKVITKGVTGAAGGVYSTDTALNWANMSNSQRGIMTAVSVASFIPVVGGVVKLQKVTVPLTKGGQVTIWKGVSVAGKPILGISKKSPTIGSKGVKYVDLTDIEPGFKPETLIEKNVLATKKALTKMGMKPEEIQKITSTLKTRGMFAGKSSPFEPKTIQPEEVKALNQKGVADVLEHSIKNGQAVERVYGSITIKKQLDPKLQNWRKPADIDIQLKVNNEEAANFTKELANKLKKSQGAKNVKVSKDKPTLIETKDATGWHHAVDIHSKDEVILGDIAKETERSIGKTGEYSYGMKVDEPGLSVEYPGVGKIKIMRLSESGKRKADAILQWQKNGIVAPQEHRLKDISDYYVILRTYKGEKIANQWAKDYGYDPGKLLSMADEAPLTNSLWEFSPSVSKAKSGLSSPSLKVNLPSSVGVSKTSQAINTLPKSQKLPSSGKINTPISQPVSGIIAVNQNLKTSDIKSQKIKTESPKIGVSKSQPASGDKSDIKTTPASNNKTSPPAESNNTPKINPPESSINPPPPPSPGINPPPPEIEPSSPEPPPVGEPPLPPPPENNDKPFMLKGKTEFNDKKTHTFKDRANAVTWKQGIGYWIVYPDKSIEWSKEKPEGVREISGPDKNKPNATIQVFKPQNKARRIVEFDADLGIQDIKVRKKGNRIVNIRFKQDRNRMTSNPVKLRFKSEKRGKIYHTRVGKGEVISRRPL